MNNFFITLINFFKIREMCQSDKLGTSNVIIGLDITKLYKDEIDKIKYR